jgi:hypothetical protein
MTENDLRKRTRDLEWEEQDGFDQPVNNRMTDQWMQRAVDLFQQGEREKARVILARLVMSEPGNPEAWFALSRCLDDLEHRDYCLRKVLVLDPGHRMAKRMLTPKTRPQPKPIKETGYEYPGAFLFDDERRKKRFLVTVTLTIGFFIAAAVIVDGILR